MNGNSIALRRKRSSFAALVALFSAIAVLAVVGTRESHAAGHDHGVAAATSSGKAVAFHDAMRALWEAHGAWTHMVIVSFVSGNPDLKAEERVLLQNQVDIGNAVKPYYGAAAGNKLIALLKAHILGAVTVLEAAKSGDKTKLAHAVAAWSANGRQIADFLHAANPHAWSRTTMRAMMKTHLDQTLAEATHRLQGNYAADIADYERIHRHILEMADTLSAGIMAQFPGRFR